MMQRGIPFSTSDFLPQIQELKYVTFSSELNSADDPLKHLAFSAVTEIGVKRAFLLNKEPHLIPLFSSTGEQRQIQHRISRTSTNAIYMIQCTKCHTQYIGEARRRISGRFEENRRAVEKALKKEHQDQPTAASEHFSLTGHSTDHLQRVSKSSY